MVFREMTAVILGLVLPTLAQDAAYSNSFKEKCLALNPQDVVFNASVNVLEFVAAGTNLTFPDNDPTCKRASQVVTANLCRIAMSIPTSNRSGIVYEMWLPENYDGRILATGNGGIDGCIKYEDIAYGAANGFATMGTNNGHNGTGGTSFFENEDVVMDFAWRSLHTSVEVGKNLTALFFGQDPLKSYYIGCSLGGRQGIKAAEMFPGDFDGIVAGAPAVDFNALYSWRASFFPILGAKNTPDFISADTWKITIHNEVLAQCDEIDGVKDGIITDPTLCKFRPETIQCGFEQNGDAGNDTNCLSAAQVQMITKIFSNYTWENGTLLYPGMQPGSEILAAGGLYSGEPYAPSEGWLKYAVLEDPDWDPAAYSLDDALKAVTKNPGGVNTFPSSLAAFEGRGGKVITYHGQQDQQITSFNSARFYEHLSEGMGYTATEMDRFLRFFRVPGMGHCSGGPGAWMIGQGGSSARSPFDGEHNVLAAIVDWVDKGVAPESIVGTKFVDDELSKGVDYTHRHCKYPKKDTYKESGLDPLNLDSWECV